MQLKTHLSPQTIVQEFSPNFVLFMLAIMFAAIFISSFCIGRYDISILQVIKIFASKFLSIQQDWPNAMETVIFKVRMPRILGASLVGAALAMAGTAYQGMFKNPLVSPDILGASSGAGLGAALAISLSLGVYGIQLMSFILGFAAVMLAYVISLKVPRDRTLALVLTGILVGTLFSSGTSLLKYLADPYDKLPTITFWLMGSLSTTSFNDVMVAFFPILIGSIILYIFRWRINVMSLSEDEARSLGVETGKLRLIAIISSTLMTSASVSISGLVGWVGLLVPHLARMLIGPDFHTLLPASGIIGAAYLVLVDNIARSSSSVEIPLGVLTSIIGAPFFLLLLSRQKGGWK
ncbi:iron ABC transporter permease [Maridesulfovibrio ferrireducens]|uniref:FecCD family ABC transporter permease n=1 Tax=Maridesulfovibrio ferrireducens TaxID=246191 RepID=UPI001A22DDF5|nr:iron ABC transporter permease [Maridesulfovibrio ferrireducens]MBI9113097.1 iron ABC transporter permease [Maridesulfovibrio ferrireducens]